MDVLFPYEDSPISFKRSCESSTKGAPVGGGRFSPSPSLKSLYKEVARRIHPDLATNEVDRARRQKLMAEANLSYQAGDEVRLRSILEAAERLTEAPTGTRTSTSKNGGLQGVLAAP